MNYVRSDNPRLADLRLRYSLIEADPNSHLTWTEEYCHREIDLPNFRADGAYLWQSRDRNTESNYRITHEYLQDLDKYCLFERLSEDGRFGAEIFCGGSGKILSRDLLDSMSELYFLEEVASVISGKSVHIWDIGAGYGRFTHRLLEAKQDASVTCMDAVAVSTFLCEFYVRFRNVDARVHVVPLYELLQQTELRAPDIAVNIHTFSECSMRAIAWWLKFLSDREVRYLLIVPNAHSCGGRKLLAPGAHGKEEYSCLLDESGYRLVHWRPKYLDPVVQEHGISPTCYYLYQLRGS